MHVQERMHPIERHAGRRQPSYNVFIHNCLTRIGGLTARLGRVAAVSCVLAAAAFAQEAESGWTQTGNASWYGPGFAGRPTASGETYDPANLTAAHPTLPLGSLVRVHNLSNDRNMIVRINDRGPFARGRIIDVSRAAADVLGFRKAGVAKVRLTAVAPPPTTMVVASALPSVRREDAAPAAPKEAGPAFVTESSQQSKSAGKAPSAALDVEAAASPSKAAGAARGSGAGPRYFVQVGAFRDKRHAQELQQSSSALGMALQVQFSDELHRVLAGPFESSAAAEDAIRELARSGTTAVLRKQ